MNRKYYESRWVELQPLPLESIAHVTYTHTSYYDVWPLLWPELERFTRAPQVTSVLCINQRDARVPGWLQQEIYPVRDDEGKPLGFGSKLAACVSAVKRPYVVLVQEDFIPLGPTNWTWISSHGRLLSGAGRPSFLSLFPISKQRESWHPACKADPALHIWHTFAIQTTLWRVAPLLHILRAFPGPKSPEELEMFINEYPARLQRGVVINSREWEAPEGFMASYSDGWGYFEALHGRQFVDHGTSSTAYPSMSTAVIGGKWALDTTFGPKLLELLRRHKVNESVRGTTLDKRPSKLFELLRRHKVNESVRGTTLDKRPSNG